MGDCLAHGHQTQEEKRNYKKFEILYLLPHIILN